MMNWRAAQTLNKLLILPENPFRLGSLQPKDFFRQRRLYPRQFPMRESISLHHHDFFQRIAKHAGPKYLQLKIQTTSMTFYCNHFFTMFEPKLRIYHGLFDFFQRRLPFVTPSGCTDPHQSATTNRCVVRNLYLKNSIDILKQLFINISPFPNSSYF